jgi:hypothetical protein
LKTRRIPKEGSGGSNVLTLPHLKISKSTWKKLIATTAIIQTPKNSDLLTVKVKRTTSECWLLTRATHFRPGNTISREAPTLQASLTPRLPPLGALTETRRVQASALC